MIQWITGILAATLLLTSPAIPAHGGSLPPHRRTHHRTYGSSHLPRPSRPGQRKRPQPWPTIRNTGLLLESRSFFLRLPSCKKKKTVLK